MWPGETIYVVNQSGDYLDSSRSVRASSARCSASLPTGRPISRIWRRRLEQRRAARISFRIETAPLRQDSPAPALLAGTEWVGVIETIPNAAIMAPAASIRNTSLLVGAIAVLCAAVLAVLIARSLTRPIVAADRGRSGGSQQGQGRHSGRCTAARPACSRARLRRRSRR